MDERKFSMAFYVMFTSANPARAYIMKSDAIIRASDKAYYPIDLLDPPTYVCEGTNIYKIRFADEVSFCNL